MTPPAMPAATALDAAFVAAVLLAMHVGRRWMPLYALLVLPGTVLHEGTHCLAGLLTGARPAAFRVFPQRVPGSRNWTLGAAGFRHLTWYNALPVALAPLLLAPVALLLAAWSLGEDARAWAHWAGLYGATALALSCLPSRTDWSLAFSRPLGALCYLALGATLFALVLAR